MEKFEEKVRSPTMFGPVITTTEVEHLFVLYTSCWCASPDYMSKNKESGKHKRRNASASSSTRMVEPQLLRGWDQDECGFAPPIQAFPSDESWWVPFAEWQGPAFFAQLDSISAENENELSF